VLVIRAEQWRSLEVGGTVQFVDRLCAVLREQERQRLGVQPRALQRSMVAHGVATAGGYGLSRQDAIASFVALQLGSTPDFHTHERVRGILASSVDEGARVQGLIESVEPEFWSEQRQRYTTQAWFEPIHADNRAHCAAANFFHAFPEAASAVSDAQLAQVLSGVVSAAARHGIRKNAGLAVYAAATLLYGMDFDTEAGPEWSSRVFALPPLEADRVEALLRLRIALDTGVML